MSNSASNYALEKVIEETKKLSVSEDLHREHLLGDEFSRSWDIQKLTLPKCFPKFLTSVNAPIDAKSPLLSIEDYFGSDLPACALGLIPARFSSLDCLTSGDAKVVYKVTLKIDAEPKLHYEPGDSIGILCHNPKCDVDWLLNRLELEIVSTPDDLFTLNHNCTLSHHVPKWLHLGKPVTARFLLTQCCELNIPVTRRITRLFADYCVSDAQSNRLLELSSREGHQMFETLIKKPGVHLFDLLYSFPSCRPPFLRVLEILPRLQPRAYSLINLPTNSINNEQDLCFIFTRFDFPNPTELDAPIGLVRYPHKSHGICSGWLERIWMDGAKTSGLVIYLYLRENLTQFRLPKDFTKPVIMVAAGSGLAPFLSFIAQRKQDQLANKHSLGQLWLMYGCRSPKTSLLFPKLLNEALEDNVLDHLCLCFSRDTVQSSDSIASFHLPQTLCKQACFPIGARYVQDCIFKKCPLSAGHPSNHTIQLIDLVFRQNAKIMVCGDAKGLAPAVASAWVSLFALKNNYEQTAMWSAPSQLTEGDFSYGRAFLQELRTCKRYQEDIWF